jgi:RNA polymerase-binding protein DksA
MIKHAQLEKYRDRLEAMQGRLDRDQRLLKQEALQSVGGEAGGGISNVPLHQGDLGSHHWENELNLRLVASEEVMIREIQDALDRIEEGTFGACEHCGRDIGRDRLQALPHARYCIRCAQELELGRI